MKQKQMKEWKIVSNYKCGKKHFNNGILCQDRTFSYIKKNKYCISLSDGAGSFKNSQIGAEIVTNKICVLVLKKFKNIYNSKNKVKVRKFLINKILKELRKESKIRNLNIKEFSATMLFVCVYKNKFIAGHIGDGVIGYLENNEVKTLSHPDNGEFKNETTFITSNNAYRKLRIFLGKIDSINGFVLISDGTAESLYSSKEKKLSGNALPKIFKWFEQYSLNQINIALNNNMETIFTENSMDDCSINILSKRI